MLLIAYTKFCADSSKHLKNIAIYNKISKSTSTDSAWPKESVDQDFLSAVPKFGMYLQIMELMKCTKFCFDRLKFCQDIASNLILGQNY